MLIDQHGGFQESLRSAMSLVEDSLHCEMKAPGDVLAATMPPVLHLFSATGPDAIDSRMSGKDPAVKDAVGIMLHQFGMGWFQADHVGRSTCGERGRGCAQRLAALQGRVE